MNRRRHVRLCLGYLAGGVVVTVLVAWGCALFSSLTETAQGRVIVRFDRPAIFPWMDAQGQRPMIYREAQGFGLRAVANIHNTSFVNQYYAPVLDEREEDDAPNWVMPHSHQLRQDTHYSTAVGWPMLCLSAQCVQSPNLTWWFVEAFESDPVRISKIQALPQRVRGQYNHMTDWRNAIVVREQQGPFTARVLPYRPIVTGLIVNVLFWALILLLLHQGLTFAAYHVRRRRGLCPVCGYDLRGGAGVDAGCPECGWHREMAQSLASRYAAGNQDRVG